MATPTVAGNWKMNGSAAEARELAAGLRQRLQDIGPGIQVVLCPPFPHLALVKEPIREITIGALAGYGQTEQAAALLQNGLTKIGIPSKIVPEPWPVASGKMRDEQQMYDLLFLWRSTYYADPNNWVGEMYACDQIGARNNSWYCNEDVDALLMEARTSTDMDLRRANYEKAATMVMEDAAGIFIYNTKWFGPFNKKVKGVRFSPIGNGQEMRWVYFDD